MATKSGRASEGSEGVFWGQEETNGALRAHPNRRSKGRGGRVRTLRPQPCLRRSCAPAKEALASQAGLCMRSSEGEAEDTVFVFEHVTSISPWKRRSAREQAVWPSLAEVWDLRSALVIAFCVR